MRPGLLLCVVLLWIQPFECRFLQSEDLGERDEAQQLLNDALDAEEQPTPKDLTDAHLNNLRRDRLSQWTWKDLEAPSGDNVHILCGWMYNWYFPYYTLVKNVEPGEAKTRCESTIPSAHRTAADISETAIFKLCRAFSMKSTSEWSTLAIQPQGNRDKYFVPRECLMNGPYMQGKTSLAQLESGYTPSTQATKGANKLISTAWFGNPSTDTHKAGAFDSITALALLLGPLGYKFNFYCESTADNILTHDFGDATEYIQIVQVPESLGDLVTGLPGITEAIMTAIDTYMGVLEYPGYRACTMAFKKDLLFVLAAYKHGGFFIDTLFKIGNHPTEGRPFTAAELDAKLQSAVAGVGWPMYPMNGANVATDRPDLVEINALYSPYPEHVAFQYILEKFLNSAPANKNGRFLSDPEREPSNEHEIMLGKVPNKPPTKVLGEAMVFAVSTTLLQSLQNSFVPPQFGVWDTEWLNWPNDNRKHLLFTPLGLVKVYSGSHRRAHCGVAEPSEGECSVAKAAEETMCAPFMEACCFKDEERSCAVVEGVATCVDDDAS